MPMVKRSKYEDFPQSALMAEMILVLLVEIDVAFSAKPPYRLKFIFKVTVEVVHTAVDLLETGTGLNIINALLIPPT